MLKSEKSAKEIKKELEKMNEEIREKYILNIKKWYGNIRNLIRDINEKLMSVEMAYHNNVIPTEVFVEQTYKLAWEFETVFKYVEEQLLATTTPKDEIEDEDGILTFGYDRKNKDWSIYQKDNDPLGEEINVLVGTLDKETIEEMRRRIFESLKSEIDAEQTDFHLRYKININNDQDLIPI